MQPTELHYLLQHALFHSTFQILIFIIFYEVEMTLIEQRKRKRTYFISVYIQFDTGIINKKSTDRTACGSSIPKAEAPLKSLLFN